jgi:3-deoxy-D-manno-octulosonic-acid transferase
VGEGLMARPVIAGLRARRPDLQVAYTFFSSSAAGFAAGVGADFTDYLPFDTPGDAEAALDALLPTALVFSKLDVWPVLAECAARRGVRLGLISAALGPDSSRASRLASALLRDAYTALDVVGAVDDDAAARLAAMGVRRERCAVTGDTRYDQAWSRAQAAHRAGALLRSLASDRPTIVAGSTWRADERVLFPAWSAARRSVPDVRLVVAPHEPTPAHLAAAERAARAESGTVARLGASPRADADVLIVDRVGILAELYALADVAYVGGGFHGAGLHSVLEPAACGVPVLVGPRHESSRDARLLLSAGGGFAADTGAALATQLTRLLTDRAARVAAGERARAVVAAGLGAVERSIALVERLLSDGG